MSGTDDFDNRRAEARLTVNALDDAKAQTLEARNNFFDAVYDRAEGDSAQVPWADLKPKSELQQWLVDNPGEGRLALDIACGLGDNAEAIAEAGYQTTGFDISAKAISWAKDRFPNSPVVYEVADLFHPPAGWVASFDLVHECYTLQALPPERFDETARAIAALVRPGGALLVYTRLANPGQIIDGPPWPLLPAQADVFADLGFSIVTRKSFDIERPDKTIAHSFTHWIKGEQA